jgi:hydroxymethylpyrimidine kinase/phosphomethylpyrimidine kinase/thiamine-phosphate diphosphorylase
MDNRQPHMRLVVNRDTSRIDIRGVYLITDQRDELVERVEAALIGGVKFVQYRHKGNDSERKYADGFALRHLCARYGATFIVNDDPELTRILDADGLHLGQDDGSPAAARQLLGPGKIIGVSTHNLEEAVRAEREGADYIGFGAMYATSSKEIQHLPGPDLLAAVRGSITIPVVAIGGITATNACRVIDAGADAVAVMAGILSSTAPDIAAAELSLLFNRRMPLPRGTVLTVAGSDSSGGAGIQADLKTVSLLGSYSASAITALTAQNTRGVTAIHGVPVSMVEDQLDAVLSDITVDVVKTGMLYSAEIIDAVAMKLREYRRKIVVVDPVMIAKGGAHLMDRDAVNALRDLLLPATYLLTPNVPEAERLTGITITGEETMEEAARKLHGMGARNVLIKGGHLPEGESVDVLFDGSAFVRYPVPRILTKNTHGTGCTLASAIATFLAQGIPLPAAVAKSKDFITSAIRLARPMGRGHGPVNHYLAAREFNPGDTEKG